MRRFYAEIWSVGNQKTIDEIVAFEFSAQFSGKQGRNHLQEFVDFCRGAFPDLQAQPTDMVAEEDLVVTTVLWSGTYQGGPKEVFGIPDSAIGAKMTNKSIDYARIKDGQLVAGWGIEAGWRVSDQKRNDR